MATKAKRVQQSDIRQGVTIYKVNPHIKPIQVEPIFCVTGLKKAEWDKTVFYVEHPTTDESVFKERTFLLDYRVGSKVSHLAIGGNQVFVTRKAAERYVAFVERSPELGNSLLDLFADWVNYDYDEDE